MIEVKFRAYIVSEKRMTEVSQVDFYCKYILNEEGKEYSFDEIKLMQYTGLKDKNRKEIYEGDIVNTVYYFDGPPSKTPKQGNKVFGTERVIFEKGSFKITRYPRKPYTTRYSGRENFSEVIGNIYENPELLSEQK